MQPDTPEERSPTQNHFRIFAVGSMLVLGGLFVAVGANFYVEPSLKQEIIAACALLIASIGGFGALYGYLRLLFSRFRSFLDNNHD